MNARAYPSRSLEDVLAEQRVFGQLDADARSRLAPRFVLRRFQAGGTIAEAQRLHDALRWIVSGQVTLRDAAFDVTVTLQPGELFGYGAGRADDPARWAAVAATECEIASLQPAQVTALCDAHPPIAYFLRTGTPAPDGGPQPSPQTDPYLNLMTLPIRSLVRREAITLPPTASIQQAACLMRDRRVSSILIVEQDHLFGLVTDRDLRNRVVAQGLPIDRPIAEIATLAPLVIDLRSHAFDALLLMARHNIHHVPVMDGHRVAGMITATDLTEQHSTSAVYLAGEIHEQDSVDGLVRASARIGRLQQNLAAADATAYATGHMVTTITDALTARLLRLGEARLGPAPVDYAWVAAGSQARGEQTARSDQDNCMILDDGYDEAAHGAYFNELSRFVCDGLDACGYEYCPGAMMAMTDTWRQPLRQWKQYFRAWTQEPDPTALMLTCVFFDMRLVDGRAELLDALRRDALRQTQGNLVFLANMVGLALAHRPALGLFGNLAPIRGGERHRTIDLKHAGVVPIVDLARVHALAGGLDAVNTHDRLAAAAQAGQMSEQNARDLRDALEFLAVLRIRHQAGQLSSGRSADNFIPIDDLSNFERSQLRDAFSVVQTVQKVLAQRYR